MRAIGFKEIMHDDIISIPAKFTGLIKQEGTQRMHAQAATRFFFYKEPVYKEPTCRRPKYLKNLYY